MSSNLRVMFPMSVNATSLFDEIHKNAARWRRELDMTDASRSVLQRKVNLVKAAPVTPSSSRMGRKVNLLA